MPAPALGAQGDACRSCAAPLAGDQRYCLNCGARRGDARVPFMSVLEERLRRESGIAAPAGPPVPPTTGARRYALGGSPPVNPIAGVGAAALLLAALGLGVLIGSLGDGTSGDTRPVAAARPQVITVAAQGAAAPVSFTSDWPAREQGWTVQLQAIPKDGSDVAAVQAAKQAATTKGAPAVGALDTDEYTTLEGGSYVIYSGVFTGRAKAKKALRKLRPDFSGARVVKVGNGLAGDRGALSGRKKEATVGRDQLKKLQKLSPDEYRKKSAKLPDTTKLPGKAPPKDDKAPGGGSNDVTEIK